MSDYLKAAARATEILQESNQSMSCLNISAAMKEVAREFSERMNNNENFIYGGNC